MTTTIIETGMPIRTTSQESRVRRAKRPTGFTLIELLVVILIIGILAALIVPKLVSHKGDAQVAAAKSDIANLSSAVDMFRLNCDRYPSDDEGLGALLTAPADVQNWKGPYIAKLPQDPWGHDYIYKHPGNNGDESFIVESQGSDGQPGGEGDAADITNTD